VTALCSGSGEDMLQEGRKINMNLTKLLAVYSDFCIVCILITVLVILSVKFLCVT
jgi:hypothetical protein